MTRKRAIGRPASLASMRRTASVTVWLRPRELRRLRAVAEAASLSMAAYVRSAVGARIRRSGS